MILVCMRDLNNVNLSVLSGETMTIYRIPWLFEYDRDPEGYWGFTLFGTFIDGGFYRAGFHCWIWRLLIMHEPYERRWIVKWGYE